MKQVDDPVVERILNMMEQRGISQKEMASTLGISDGSFSKWKNQGSKSYSKYIGQLSEILNVPVSYLISGDVNGDNKPIYSENTKTMIKMFDGMSEKEQLFFLDVMKSYKTLLEDG